MDRDDWMAAHGLAEPSTGFKTVKNVSLGEKLQTTLKELEAANLIKLEDQAAADIKKIRKEREALQTFVNSVMLEITEAIEEGRIPHVKVKDYDRQNWIRECFKNTAPHQDIWQGLVFWANNNKLEIRSTEAHDGVGIESWIVLHCDPKLQAIRSANLNLKESEGLGVGDYRG